MLSRYILQTALRKIAIFFIAFCAINTWTTAQITSNLPASNAVGSSAQDSVQQERLRIAQQRIAAQLRFDSDKAACYQKFAVNACITQAQIQQREVLADLKRRDVALNDSERKRLGVAQQQKTDAKTSPEQQVELSARRGEALANTAERQARSAQKLADKKVATQPAGQPGTAKTAPKAQAPKVATPKVPRSPAEAALAKAQYDKRQLEAAQHRAKVLAEQQGKKPAEGLPIPAN